MRQDAPSESNFGAEHINLSQVPFTPELVQCLPARMAREFRAIPVYKNEKRVGIAVADPSDLNAIDTLVHFLSREIELFVADKYLSKKSSERG
jgi:type IV pilus assembly protein PilB